MSEDDTVEIAPNDSAQRRPSEGRIHKCQQCSNSFSRIDHLKRHMKLHSGDLQYKCPCGSMFSRNDVLARHLRRCEKAGNDPSRPVKPTGKQTRAKSACNQCAEVKIKCDSQNPCGQCKRKGLVCEYTRGGYSDPYNSYRVQSFLEEPLSPGPAAGQNSPLNDLGSRNSSAGLQSIDATLPMDFVIPTDLQPITDDPMNIDYTTLNSAFTNDDLQQYQSSASLHDMVYMPVGFDFSSVFDFSFDPDVSLFQSQVPDDINFDDLPREQPNLQIDQASIIAPAIQKTLAPSTGFSLYQIDPVEAKCIEMRDLLVDAELPSTPGSISTYITREHLVKCIELYGKHFQPNVPIIHMPTFRLMDTPPVLLLAMMLSGACYSNGLIPLPTVSKLAMRLLVSIENQPHEKDMEVPPLSTIQASIILRPVLVLSKNETAFKFASMNFARNISMAERAGLFDSIESVDYSTVLTGSFDWNQWIEQEVRRRIACQIFCQDMALCVFYRRSPSFSPLNFNVNLPCYESCWDAPTASECVTQLRSLPRQIKLSAAIQRVGSDIDNGGPTLEISAFGMFTLILSLHCLLYQATDNNAEFLMESPKFPPLPNTDFAAALNHFRKDFSGNYITMLADALVDKAGSSTIKRMNNILNKWLQNWNLRQIRDLDKENHTFSADPMRFFWLAKLFLVLHMYRHSIDKDNEFAVLSNGGADEQAKARTQLKIVSWLMRFRDGTANLQASDETYLSQLLKPLQSE